MSTKVSFKNKEEYIKHLELEIYRLQGQTFHLQQDVDYWKQQARKFMSRLVEVIEWYGDEEEDNDDEDDNEEEDEDDNEEEEEEEEEDEEEDDNEDEEEDDNEDEEEDENEDEEEPIMSWRDWWRESQEEWKCWWNMGKKYR
jgi:hypothetical protein